MAPHTHIPAPRNTIETYSARPEREPPRNENGEIICQHENCRGKNEIFRRPCEWNKHMDKHERPYKCSEPTCEQNPGFTYSGGLLRHMREVHKKGVGPTRRPLYCPHANCIRSTGEGFTRRENLEEHLRRRHSYTGHYSPPPQSASSQNGEEGQDRPSKRRKTHEPESPNGVHMPNGHNQVQLNDGRRHSELHNVIDERLYTNGAEGESEILRQLNLARQAIADQQDIITRQEYELQHLRARVAQDSPFDSKPLAERNLLEAAPALEALAAQLQLPENQLPDDGKIDPTAPAPHEGDTSLAVLQAQQSIQAGEDMQAENQQQADRDSVNNGSEPSRRIEIARDLVSERVANAITAT